MNDALVAVIGLIGLGCIGYGSLVFAFYATRPRQ